MKMKMQIKKFAQLSGVSVRTLHYYDEIGLLHPAEIDADSGYRYYDANSLMRMQEILFFRELDFSLESIRGILDSSNYDKEKIFKEQKNLLILKKERLERLILAVEQAMRGEVAMEAFQNTDFEQYKNEVKERWGMTQAYAEYQEKSKGDSKEKQDEKAAGLQAVFSAFADCMKAGNTPDSAEGKELVKKLQEYITKQYYQCTDAILAGLGQMYVADERFKKNIDASAEGTAEFVSKAIEAYCHQK